MCFVLFVFSFFNLCFTLLGHHRSGIADVCSCFAREFKMFRFPVLKSPLHFPDVEVIAIPATCLVNDLMRSFTR